GDRTPCDQLVGDRPDWRRAFEHSSLQAIRGERRTPDEDSLDGPLGSPPMPLQCPLSILLRQTGDANERPRCIYKREGGNGLRIRHKRPTPHKTWWWPRQIKSKGRRPPPALWSPPPHPRSHRQPGTRCQPTARRR